MSILLAATAANNSYFASLDRIFPANSAIDDAPSSKEGIFSEETCIGLKISFSNNDHDSFSEPELFFVST
nr:hypothetical protein [Klebsiella pneumoniae]